MLKTVSSVTNAIGALNFKGTWNATTNTPTIVSGVGVKGDYFVVSVAGSTTIDGISNWGVGDWITYNGSVWQRVEGGADLNGVNLSVSGTSTLSGLTASTALALNASKEIVSVTNTGTGDNVLATSATLVTPTLGVAAATSINKVALTAPATGSTLTIADGKTLAANHSLTLAGTDATTMTFPTTSATIARTDAAQSFAGTQTMSDLLITAALSVNLSGDNQQVATTKSFVQLSGNGAPRSGCFFQAGTASGQVLRIRGATWAVTVINNPSGTQNAYFNANAASATFGNGSGEIAAMDLVFDASYGANGSWFELGRSTFP
jgi:hypothetical protein